MKCKAYTGAVSTELNLDGRSALSYWYQDPLALLEVVKGFKGLGGFRLSKIAALLDLARDEEAFGYVLEYGDERSKKQETVFVVCSRDPDEFYREVLSKKLEWKDYPIYRFYKSVLLDNYVNVLQLPELDGTIREAIELLVDASEYSSPVARSGVPDALSRRFEELSSRSAFLFTSFYIVYPLSNAIFVDLVAGSITSCFLQLRLLVEAAVKSVIIDYLHRFGTDPLTGIDSWERRISDAGLRMSTILKEHLGVILGIERAEKVESLWSRLSRRWAHLGGYIERIKDRAEKVKEGKIPPGEILPADMLVLPCSYDESFEMELKELWRTIREVRELLCDLYTEWIRLVREFIPDIAQYTRPCRLRLLGGAEEVR